ncbi:MAG: transcriptional repressor [Anaerolineaceae bacterium]|nr:transcriptional repressor [Anaerolineaceae bacterium]MBN2676663.1 transcriptional repressor [Anaerolineaceae bacterium]
MNDKLDLTTSIRSQGRKLTQARKLVFEILEQSREHLDAETIFERARQKNNRIGLATVYRTLALLKEMGLVNEHQFGQDHGHFETVQNNQPHYHFSCIKCGRVMECRYPQVLNLARDLCEKEGLQVLDVAIHLSGYCAQCRSGDGNNE